MAMIPGSPIDAADVDPYPHRRRITREEGSSATYVLLTDTAPHRWAIVQYQVGGWDCLAVGEFTPPSAPKTWGSVFGPLIDAYGDGFARIPRDDYGLISDTAEIIHIRRDTPARIGAYCGISITRPYNPGAPHRYKSHMQHCTNCTRIYRAEHFGRCPVEA